MQQLSAARNVPRRAVIITSGCRKQTGAGVPRVPWVAIPAPSSTLLALLAATDAASGTRRVAGPTHYAKRDLAQGLAAPGYSHPAADPLSQHHPQQRSHVPQALSTQFAQSATLAQPPPTAAVTASQATSAAASSGGCPFHKLTAALSTAVSSAATPPSPPTHMLDHGSVPMPGPDPISIEVLLDAQYMLTEGMHEAVALFDRKYGPISRFANPPFIKAIAGVSGWVFLNSPDALQHVCVTNARNYAARYMPDTFAHITGGKGLWGSQNQYHAHHRRLCTVPFRNPEQMQRRSATVVDRCEQLVGIWREAATGMAAGAIETDVSVQAQRLATDMMGLLTCSHDFGQLGRVHSDLGGAHAHQDSRTSKVLSAVEPMRSKLTSLFVRPVWLLKYLNRLGLPYLRQLDGSVEATRQAMSELVKARRSLLASGAEGPDDLLTTLLKSTDKSGRPLSDDEVWWDLYDMLGGIYSTSRTLAVLLHCVSATPGVQQRLQEEIDGVLGSAAPTFESLERMPYLQSVLMETLRLYPAVQVSARRVAQDDVLPSGQAIAAGDVVIMSSYALGRSADLWDQPLAFNPDRFAPDAIASHHRFQWLPFGAGPRMCPGNSFAQMAVSLLAARLLQSFSFTPLTSNSPIIPVGYDDLGMSFTPTKGLRLRIQPRA